MIHFLSETPLAQLQAEQVRLNTIANSRPLDYDERVYQRVLENEIERRLEGKWRLL